MLLFANQPTVSVLLSIQTLLYQYCQVDRLPERSAEEIVAPLLGEKVIFSDIFFAFRQSISVLRKLKVSYYYYFSISFHAFMREG